MKKNDEKMESLSMDTMDNDEMDELLHELSETQFWQAIKRIVRFKDTEVMNSLASLDPFKQPTEVARNQGMRMGLYFLENYLDVLSIKKNDQT